MRFWRWVLAAMVWGCSDGAGQSGADAAVAPVPSPPGGGIALAEKSRHDFRSVRVGEQQTLAIRIFGERTRASTIRVVSIFGEHFHPLGFARDVPIVVPPRTSRTLDIAFRPPHEGTFLGHIDVDLCEAGCGARLTLEGKGVSHTVACTTDREEQSAQIEQCAVFAVKCQNPTLDVVEIPLVSLEPADSAFALLTERFFVTPGSGAELPITFCPREARAYDVVLTLGARRSGDGEVDHITVPIRGRGYERGVSGCSFAEIAPVKFDLVEPGMPGRATLRTYNVLDGPCVLSSIELTGSVFTIALIPAVSKRGNVTVDLVMTASVGGYFEETLSLTYAERFGRTLIRVPVRGVSRDPGATGYVLSRILDVPLGPIEGTPRPFDESDDGVHRVPIGVPFAFDGVPVREVTLTANGWVTFERVAVSSPRNGFPYYPDARGDDAIIALWWDDLLPGAAMGGAMTTRVSGTTPDRIFHARYFGIPFAAGPPSSTVDVELRLIEGGAFEVHYGELAGAEVATSSASVGWESWDGLTGETWLACSPRCTARDWPANTVIRLEPR